MLLAAGALNVKREQRKRKDEEPRPLFEQLDDEDVPSDEDEPPEDVT